MSANPKIICQALKGNTSQIVLAFLLAACALDVQEVMEWTGLSRPAASAGLARLKGMEILATQRGAHGRVVYLFGSDQLFRQMSTLFTSGSLSSGGGHSKNLVCVSTTTTILSAQMSTFFTPEKLAALDAAGIRDPKRAELLNLEHVTVELINYHVEQAKKDGAAVGRAVYRIANNWPIVLELGDSVNARIDAKLAGIRARALQDDEEEE